MYLEIAMCLEANFVVFYFIIVHRIILACNSTVFKMLQ